MNKHLQAIRSGSVTKSNVIGIRKALNTEARRINGLSVSRTAPKLSDAELVEIERALADLEPLVEGELHESGVKLLRNRRHRKALGAVLPIVDHPNLHFRLVAFDQLGSFGQNATPVYRAHCGTASFLFRNIPWQSGGNGPEVLKICC